MIKCHATDIFCLFRICESVWQYATNPYQLENELEWAQSASTFLRVIIYSQWDNNMKREHQFHRSLIFVCSVCMCTTDRSVFGMNAYVTSTRISRFYVWMKSEKMCFLYFSIMNVLVIYYGSMMERNIVFLNI